MYLFKKIQEEDDVGTIEPYDEAFGGIIRQNKQGKMFWKIVGEMTSKVNGHVSLPVEHIAGRWHL